MHHLVADSDWSDTAWLAAVAKAVVPSLTGAGTGAAKSSGSTEACYWIVDDTGMPKKGTHSVGVARQCCGQLGKTENCQVAVSLSIAAEQGSLPLYDQLYLPSVWTDDSSRCEAAGVPERTRFEGRNWRGFHHHASLCIAAYGFLMKERLSRVKKRRSILTTCPTRGLPSARVSPRCSVISRTQSPPCDFVSGAPSQRA